ncbi:ribonuclease P protein component [Patescibacteria group bacterium]|nr:ribonuclease P protein component [Patescibacteria group bacterium]
MLKKENRLSTRYEYRTTRQHGAHHAGEFTYVFILQPRNYSGPARIGIVTSKKFHKNAVVRNRIKRLYREIVRENLPKISKNLWIVIQPRVKSIGKTYEEISSDFNKILSKTSIFN